MIVTVVLLTTKQSQIYPNKKKAGGNFNGIIIQTHGLYISVTVLYQLSYRLTHWVQAS